MISRNNPWAHNEPGTGLSLAAGIPQLSACWEGHSGGFQLSKEVKLGRSLGAQCEDPRHHTAMAQVQYLVGELRSCKPSHEGKKEKEEKSKMPFWFHLQKLKARP